VVALRMQGALGLNQVVYAIGFDTDNDPATGAPLDPLAPGSQMTGVDFALLVTANENATGPVQVREAVGGALQIVPVAGVTAQALTATIIEHGPDALPPEPLTTDIIFRLTPAALNSLGLDIQAGRLFPDGLAVQAATIVTVADGEQFVDLAPDAPALLGFPDTRFPSIDVSGPVCAGDPINVSVSGLANGREIKVFLGETMISPGVVTNSDGDASFTVTVPHDAVPGPTLLTVGVKDPTNAVTADTIIDICPVDDDRRRTYPAKVICGTETTDPSVDLSSGRYTTIVNVFNPGPRPVRLDKTLALAVPPGAERPGRVFEIARAEELLPGHAMAVQCRERR
jgi:hypothetical protein